MKRVGIIALVCMGHTDLCHVWKHVLQDYQEKRGKDMQLRQEPYAVLELHVAQILHDHGVHDHIWSGAEKLHANPSIVHSPVLHWVRIGPLHGRNILFLPQV